LVLGSVGLALAPTFVLRRAQVNAQRAEEQLFHHAWTLERLVTKEAPAPRM
jgi:hypothetical protein